jgi:very-short-patch-repair endonuclease
LRGGWAPKATGWGDRPAGATLSDIPPPPTPPLKGEGLAAERVVSYQSLMTGSGDPRDQPARTRRAGGPVHVKLAQRLRGRETHWELRLWTWLRTLRKAHGLHFRRQVPIGRFIADFACHSAKLIIELDGPFHEPEADAERDAWFAKAGYRTLRFPNEVVVSQWDRVVSEIEHSLGLGDRLSGPLTYLQTPTPDPSPSPMGGEL